MPLRQGDGLARALHRAGTSSSNPVPSAGITNIIYLYQIVTSHHIVFTHKFTRGNFVDVDGLPWRLLDSHPRSEPTGTTAEARCGSRWGRVDTLSGRIVDRLLHIVDFERDQCGSRDARSAEPGRLRRRRIGSARRRCHQGPDRPGRSGHPGPERSIRSRAFTVKPNTSV
jgi:hypothetical protein